MANGFCLGRNSLSVDSNWSRIGADAQLQLVADRAPYALRLTFSLCAGEDAPDVVAPTAELELRAIVKYEGLIKAWVARVFNDRDQ